MFLWNRVLLNSPGWHQRHNSLDFTLQMLVLQACATIRSWNRSHFDQVQVIDLSMWLLAVPLCLQAFRLDSRTWRLFPVYFCESFHSENISKSMIHFELLKYKIWYWGRSLWWLTDLLTWLCLCWEPVGQLAWDMLLHSRNLLEHTLPQ